MSALDPSYLRSIRDGILSGNIEANNTDALPDGLVGLYDKELFPPTMKWKERKETLDFFLVFALAQKEISADFAAEILGDEWYNQIDENTSKEEKRIQRVNDLVQFHSKRLSSAGGGKYRLYHERFKVYVLQKSDIEILKKYKFKFILLLEKSIIEKKGNELEVYALEFIAHHYMVHYIMTNDIKQMMNLVQNRSFWARQILISNAHFWTLNSLRCGINSALLANENQYVIQNIINYLSIELDLINDVDGIIEHLENGEFDISTKKLNYLENKNSKRLDLTLVYLFIYSESQLSIEIKINFLKGLELFIKNSGRHYALGLLPDLFAFELAAFCFTNNIDYTILYAKDKIDIGRERAFENKPILLNISKYEKFIHHLVSEKMDFSSTRLIDTILFTALRKGNKPLLKLVLETSFKRYSLATAEQLALYFFYENNPSEFLKVITLDDEHIHMLTTLTIRMLLKEKYEKITEFINQIPSSFYQLVLYFHMAQAAMILDKNLIKEDITALLKNQTRFSNDDSSELISMLELQEFIIKYPEKAIQFIDSDITTINQVITALGFRESVIQFYRKSKVNLYRLNQLNINRISKLLGSEGATDEFILEKQIEIKRTSNSLFLGGYNWEDESVLFFIRGMAERNFKNEFLKLFFFLQGPENLGVLYRIDPIRIKYRLLFYLYSNLNQDKEKKKGLIVREIILNNLEKSKFDEDPEEITRRYLDMCYSENRLLEAANEKIISGLKKNKIYWDSDYHLAKIAVEYLERGDGELGFIILNASHPKRWKIQPITAARQWKKIIEKFLDYFILNQDVDKCIELVKRSKNHAEILHKISKEIQIIDEETKEKMQTMMRTFVNKLDIDHFDRITREVKHKDFFSGLILEAELLNYLYSYEKSRIAYSYVCENLKVIKNHDDLQIILNKLCQSLVKNKCVEFYSYIINNLHIISTFVVPYGVEGWQKTLFLFRDELESIKDSESIKIIDSKISILPPITINKDTKSTMSIKNKPTGYYLVPFENYKMSLYNSSSQEMLNSIIRNASYQCFVNIMNNPNNIILLSEELGLTKWMILGFEIQLHIKNKNI